MARGTILIVEDDPAQRDALAALLRQQGHDVREAGSAEEALARLEEDAIDLVVADYQLAGATGTWLARVAARSLHRPPRRAIIVTGHETVADIDGITVLRKPLDIDRFMDAIGLALDAPAPPQPLDGPAQRIALVLYVTDSLASRRVRKSLETLMARYDVSQIALTIVELTPETAAQADEHRIVVTPTLLKTFPAPRVWITGELEPPAILERLFRQAGVEARP
jgi:DNA-binding NtrC family response regulator